jgi:HAD superfamily phosphoserine phosphatase-like hydrolase
VRVVLDWDGTATEVDTLELVLREFGDVDVFERAERALLSGEMSYRALMEAEFASVRAPLAEVRAWLAERARLRPGLRELARDHEVLILSSGFEELIRPLLAQERLELELVANRIDPRPDGWRIVWSDAATCLECGDLCKRRSLPHGALVYVGDGYSDRCAALAAERVFARDTLADWLRSRGTPFEPFDDLVDVATALRDGATSSPAP